MSSDNPFDSIMKEFEAELQKILQDKNFWKEVGDFAVSLIVKRTRLGFGVESGGSEKVKLDEMRVLSPKYIIKRKQMAGMGTLSNKTAPKKNNLTLTGEMLDSLQSFFISNMIYIGFKPSSFAKEKAEHCAELGKKFNFLSSSELKQVRQFIQKKMEEKLISLGILKR